ncbi:glycosyltransferase [Agrobacterium radiobacter]|uniref:glycosyltransferase n=1 Tax=Agrobacterium radiobacter TaxID=362 RepID=UPI0034660A75
MAFHRSGKPRGWFRAIAFSKKSGDVRPLFRGAFYKKNGNLRPDFAAFVNLNPHYFKSVFPIAQIQLSVDANDTPRKIFSRQQSELTSDDARELIARLQFLPLVSVVMPVYNTPTIWLRRAIESLQEQFYENWELCVVDDCSTQDQQRLLLTELAKTDPRIRFAALPANGGISVASNHALEMARGEYVALLDHDDEITPDALLRMVESINTNPQADFFYSDECKIDDTPDRRLSSFILKPDWSPEIMFNFMITGHLTVYRTALVREIGGFRSEYDFSQDYDLALRMAEVSREIVHVERILYLWRAIQGSAASGGKDFARLSNIAALQNALDRRGIRGNVEMLPHANCVRIPIPEEGSRVSIVVPSDSAKNLRLALDAIREGTDYDNYEVLIVCNSTVAAQLRDEYADWPAARFVHYDKIYNFSDKCNEGARAANGDIVVFYNDDVFPIGRDWVQRLIEYLWVPGVGGVSPQLLYKDGTIQYAGMISGTPGMAGTAYHALPLDHTDEFLSMNRLVRNISILSGACCALKRDVFLELGGFDARNTPDGHSDLDLSYKLLAHGLRCVYTPYSLLTHIGNHSWNAKETKYKADIFCLKHWGGYVSRDPYFTNSMRETLYPDFTFKYHIHADHIASGLNYTGPDVLFVSHELTNTGAPHMLLEAAKAVKAVGGFPVVVAAADGPLREALEDNGIVVIIDASVTSCHFLFERFARNFDLAIVNTVALRPVVEQLASISILRTIWWLHEGEALLSQLSNVPAGLWNKVGVVCVSNYAKKFLPKSVSASILVNGAPDHSANFLENNCSSPKELRFVLVGTMEPRKGQDVFVEAIIDLPELMRKDCRFIIAGKLWPGHGAFWKEIETKISRYPEINYVGNLSHDQTISLIASCDVLVAPSRDDSFSLVAIEAAQLGKPMIFSDHVGAHDILDDVCSFVFPSGNADQLRDRMIQAYEDRARLEEMGRAARQTYERELTQEKFARNFMALVEANISGWTQH